jgi:subtilisin family serine protease
MATPWSQPPPAVVQATRDAWIARRQRPVRLGSLAPRYARNHIVVKLAAGAPPAVVGRTTAQAGYRLGPVRTGARWTTVTVPPGQNARQVAARMRGLPGIETAGLDPILYLHQTHLSTDDPWGQMPPYADEPCVAACLIDLFHPDCCLELLFAHLICQQWGLFHIDIETAWSMSHGHPAVVIAVIDSGVDFDHPDIHHVSTGPEDPEVDKIWTNPGETVNGVDDDGNGYTDDIHGWDFCGTDVGDMTTEEATAANAGTPEEPGETGADSDDNNPDVFKGAGDWLWDDPDDPIYPIGFVGGDPSVGDLDDNDGNGYADIGVYHGSLVATIAAAVTDNVCPDIGYWFDGEGGFAGVGYNCTIMPLRMINAEGVGYGIDGYDAIMYAADNGADILNISWGAVNDPTHPEYDAAGNQMIHDAVQHAAAQGCVMVCSAGNFGGASQGDWTYTGGLDVPAAFAETISVGSINDQNQRSEFSSWANSTEELDVVAPGEMISGAAVWSVADAAGYAFLGEAMVDPGAADWDSNQGTSFAAPIISGLAGLILARHPTYTPEQVRWVLRNGSTDLGPSAYDPEYGYGLAGGNLDAAPEGPPLAVWIGDFSAEADKNQCVLTWQSDMGGLLAGFDIYEAPSAAGPFAKVNGRMIPADPQAGSYHFPTSARGPWFRVEAVRPDGTRAGAQVLRVRAS